MTAKILSLYLLPLALLLWLCISFLRFYIRERKNYDATEAQSEQNLESKTKYRAKERKKTIPFKVVFKRYWRVKRFRFVSRLKRMIGFFGKIFGALKWVFSNKKRTGMIVIAIVLLAGVAVMPSVVSIVQTTMRENQYEWRVLDDGTVVIDRYTGKSPEVQIPATISGRAVTRIENSAFKNSGNFLTSVIVPEGVTHIGYGAFDSCSYLTSITLPSSLTYIGASAFYRCSSLTSIAIPDCVTEIGDSAFSDCSSLMSVTLPSALINVGNSVFLDCRNLTSIMFPDSVMSIGDGAFSGCSSLTSVRLPSALTNIGGAMFYGCSSLTDIAIPDSVTSIGGAAFYRCSSLTSITIPAGLESVWYGTFEGCSSLKYIVLLTPQIKFGDSAFHDCESLERIYFGAKESPTGYIEGNNAAIHEATWYYYSEEAPTERGLYWHYVNGVPTPWN